MISPRHGVMITGPPPATRTRGRRLFRESAEPAAPAPTPRRPPHRAAASPAVRASASPALNVPAASSVLRQPDQRRHRIRARRPGWGPVGCRPGRTHRCGGVGNIGQVERQFTHVATPVVQGEEEAPRAGRPAPASAKRARSSSSIIGPQIGAASDEPGQRGGHDVADPVVGRGRQQTEVGDLVHERRRQRIRQPADLQAGPRGELELAVAVPLGQLGQRPPALGP